MYDDYYIFYGFSILSEKLCIVDIIASIEIDFINR